MATPLLAAALIVKDESATLPECLEALHALRPLLDHVVVYDTGSTDGTQDLARASGALVREGCWDGDFSRARNAAVDLTDARWVLSVDADERVVADPRRLRKVLEAALRRGSELDALWVPLVNIAPDGSEMYAAPLGRIFRPDRARFVGRLHEQVFPIDPARGDLRFAEQPQDVVQLRHVGYRDPAVVLLKAERNLAIVDAELAALEAGGGDADPRILARALYHRGRTLLTAGRVVPARADLERLLALPVRVPVPEQSWGRDVLAQLLLAVGEPGPVPALAAHLRADGVDAGYCGWLEARAMLAEGRYTEALPLLRGVHGLVDAVGRHHDVAPVLEAQMIAAGRAGEVDEAAACCIRLMAGHGRTDGLGPLLLTLWGERPAEWLVELLAGADRGHLPAVSAELRRCPAPGPSVAAALVPAG
jgi:hypothetical protein